MSNTLLCLVFMIKNESIILYSTNYTCLHHFPSHCGTFLTGPQQAHYCGACFTPPICYTGISLLQSHGWLSLIIKVFGHFPQRRRQGSWWHFMHSQTQRRELVPGLSRKHQFCIRQQSGCCYNSYPLWLYSLQWSQGTGRWAIHLDLLMELGELYKPIYFHFQHGYW